MYLNLFIYLGLDSAVEQLATSWCCVRNVKQSEKL